MPFRPFNSKKNTPPQMPITTKGLRIGLLGGSFDPPHQGHLHISHRALNAFKLDYIWWLLSPGNPLKPNAPSIISKRLKLCRHLIDHPRITVSDIEHQLGSHYTADTLKYITSRAPATRFVWLMGADNLVNLHRWYHWNDILEMIPVGVIARPHQQVAAGLSVTAQKFRHTRLPNIQAPILPFRDPPCWCLVTGRMLYISSRQIRNRGK